MSDTRPVRFIAHFSIDDPEVYRVYEKGFFPILKAHGGRFLTYDDAPVVLEGSRADGRTVMIEFDSEEALMGWWESPEYGTRCSPVVSRWLSCGGAFGPLLRVVHRAVRTHVGLDEHHVSWWFAA